jgi:hypothetical protein
MMSLESLRFKKVRASGPNGNCVEIAHTLGHLRDSKTPGGPVLAGDVRALVAAVKGGAFSS